MSVQEGTEDRPLACIYGSEWFGDALQHVVDAAREAGYRPEVCEFGEGDTLPEDASAFVFGEQAGETTGLALCRAARGAKETADIPVILYGSGDQRAIHEGWKAGADAYLGDPWAPDVAVFLARVRAARAAKSGRWGTDA